MPMKPTPRNTVREEQVTATGWRIKGLKALALVADAEASMALAAARADEILFATRLTLRPRLGTGNAANSVRRARGSGNSHGGIRTRSSLACRARRT